MIVGGKKVYHKESFLEEFDKAEMILWTIIGKNVYMERNPHYRLEEYFIIEWFNSISMMMKHPEFPESVQFWTRINNDLFKQGDKRLDL
jgi:hypothetical protein